MTELTKQRVDTAAPAGRGGPAWVSSVSAATTSTTGQPVDVGRIGDNHLPWRWLWRGVRPGLDPKCLLLSTAGVLAVVVWGMAMGWLSPADAPGYMNEVVRRSVSVVLATGESLASPVALSLAMTDLGSHLAGRWLDTVLIGVPALCVCALVLATNARMMVGTVAGVAGTRGPLLGFLRTRAVDIFVAWVGLGALWLVLWWLMRWLSPGADQAGVWMQLSDVFASGCAIMLAMVTGAAFIGLPLVTAAMAVEDADVIEATQRILAYAICRPVRVLLAWLMTAAAGTLLVFGVLWLGNVAQGVVHTSGKLNAPSEVLHSNWWATLLGLGACVFALSYAGTGAVALYLWLRERIDGQDHADLHVSIQTREIASQESTESAPMA